ncbi:serine/threonine-protein kinase [Mycetocola sp. JXN-3]|uniref:serine/threonine-protein kinase n=1 Tax=Mycetocola sp. JXN-3 TaxID=2116510 RepID=UPI002105E5B6|nr:serine/threonine-protein kinase [Mycetocola sp. JXN-3]
MQAGDPLGASYRLVSPLGAGAVGEVWRVSTTTEGPDLAAKVLRPEHAHDPQLVERFIRERSVLLALRHPNIVAVRDLVVEGDRLAIVMDFVSGGTLRDLLDERLTLPPAAALRLGAEILDALAAAHTQNTAHRDIKPDNVLLSEHWQPGQSGTVRVTDFGIASVFEEKVRHTTGLLGTPQYMSPELISHGEAGAAADVYATGILLYELLSGRTPFAGPGTDFSVAYRHVTTLPPRLEVPDELWTMLEKLLVKEPRLRPAAGEAASELRLLATRFETLQALSPSTEPLDPGELARPATMIRGSLTKQELAALTPESETFAPAPDLGEAGSRTVFRPMVREPLPAQATEPDEPVAAPWLSRFPWLTKRTALIGGGALALSAAIVAGILIFLPGGPAPSEAKPAAGNLSAQQQTPPRPSGLSTARAAKYDAATEAVTLTLTYTAQKAALTGPLLESVPGISTNGACPAVTWEGATATRNQPSVSGISATCGWSLEGVKIPAQGNVEVTATIPLAMTDQKALDTWLASAATQTTTAIEDPANGGAAFPVQRLVNIAVQTPPRIVGQSALPVTLVPIWAGGPDPLNPVYTSPATGPASALLESIAGGESGVRLADGCAGGLAVSSDGLVATALAVAPSCVLRASVGNFTDLASDPFSITTRE